MPEVSALDWMLLAVLSLSLLVGLWRGLVREVLSLVGWVAAFFVAQMEAPRVAHWLPMSGSSEMLRYAAGFLVLTAMLAWLVRRFVSAVGLGLIDRFLGGVFGLLRGAVFLLAFAVVAHMTPLVQSPAWQQSHGTPWLTRGLHLMKPLLPAEFAKFLP